MHFFSVCTMHGVYTCVVVRVWVCGCGGYVRVYGHMFRTVWVRQTRVWFTSKVKSIIMSLNFSSSQLAQILLAGFVFKVISISLDFACELGPGPSVGWG